MKRLQLLCPTGKQEMHLQENIYGHLAPLRVYQGKKVKMYFHVNASPPIPMDVATSNFAGGASHTMKVLGYISYDLDPKAKVKGQIMYFLVNASLPQLLEVAKLNYVGDVKLVRVQRSGIDTIKYHTWPMIPMEKWLTYS